MIRPLPAAIAATAFVAASSPAPAQYVEPGVARIFAIPGRAVGDLFGWRVRHVDDVNGDGVPDFAVAAPFHNLNVGRVSMHSGRNGGELWFRDGTATSSILGFDMIAIDDVDGDGVRDVAAGAPFANNLGLVVVYSGRTGATLRTLLPGAGGFSYGVSLAAGGDYDGDGTRDLVVADDANGTTRQFGGRLFVYSLPSLTLARTIAPPTGGFLFGTCLAFVGDVDGDGRDDLAVGDRLATTGPAGRLHLVGFDGATDVVRWTIGGMQYGSDIDGNKLDGGGDVDGDGIPDVIVDESNPSNRARLISGSNGAVLRTFTDLGNDGMGKSAKIVADQNHDGVPDLLIGASENSTVANWNGRLLLFSGRDFRRLRTITNTTANARFGADADLMPDVDGDGTDDLIVGAAGASGFTRSMGGAQMVHGEPALAGSRSYGSGLPGTGGSPPLLRLDSDPILGAATTLRFGNAAPGTSAALLLLGLAAASQPTAWGGTRLVDPFATSGLALAPGETPLPIGLPVDPAFVGLRLFAQTWVLDPGAAAGIAESRGLAMSLGR